MKFIGVNTWSPWVQQNFHLVQECESNCGNLSANEAPFKHVHFSFKPSSILKTGQYWKLLTRTGGVKNLISFFGPGQFSTSTWRPNNRFVSIQLWNTEIPLFFPALEMCIARMVKSSTLLQISPLQCNMDTFLHQLTGGMVRSKACSRSCWWFIMAMLQVFYTLSPGIRPWTKYWRSKFPYRGISCINPRSSGPRLKFLHCKIFATYKQY